MAFTQLLAVRRNDEGGLHFGGSDFEAVNVLLAGDDDCPDTFGQYFEVPISGGYITVSDSGIGIIEVVVVKDGDHDEEYKMPNYMLASFVQKQLSSIDEVAA